MPSAFQWDIYSDRRTALEHLRRTLTLVDTIIETEDGRAHEPVHSQVISAYGDKLTKFIQDNGVPLVDSSNRSSPQHALRSMPPAPAPTRAAMKASTGSAPSTTSTAASTTTSTTTRTTATTTSTTTTSNTSIATPAPAPVPASGQRAPISAPSAVLLTRCRTNKPLKLVRLPLVNRYTLAILVECAYTGYIRTDLASGGLWQVLDMADYYEMLDVARACCSFLAKNLTAENCVYFYHVGIKHKHPLQRSAWHQIRVNFKQIVEQNIRDSSRDVAENGVLGPKWRGQLTPATRQCRASIEMRIQANNLATMKYEHFEPLLMHDKLNVDKEELVWYAIKLWCNHDLAARARLLPSLLPCMRFPRFRAGTDFTSSEIWRDALIVNNEAAQHQLAVLDRNHRDALSAFASAPLASSQAADLRRLLPTASAASAAASALLSGGGGGGGGAGGNTSNNRPPLRDGFGLPCAIQPRQLRPRIPHSVLLAIGGWQQGQPTTLIESYDANCNLWFECRSRINWPLAYHGIEYINNLLYICGGTDGNDILNNLFTFDPVRGDCRTKPPMRNARCYVSTARLAEHLYALGGHNGAQRMRSVERFDLTTETWAHVADMNVARSDASACVHNNTIYIAGGLNDQVVESSVEFYNKRDNSWTFIQSMLVQRTSFTLLSFAHNNSLLAVGGNNGAERLNSVEQYNFQTATWREHSRMRHKRSTFSAALLDGNKLIVVGGYNGTTPFAQVEMFDENLRQWVALQKIRYDRSGLKVVVVSDLPNAWEYTFLGSQAATLAANGQPYGGAAGAQAAGRANANAQSEFD